MSALKLTRRQALGGVGALVAGSPLTGAQEPDGKTAPRIPPREDLVNTFEFEDVARLRLPAPVYATIAGSDRHASDRITFRPRVNTPTLDMDLSVAVCGQTQFTPILVGPVAGQRQYHPDGELATLRGAAAARATVIVSDRSSVAIDVLARTAAELMTPLWYAVYADANARTDVQRAVAAGCSAVCITIGAAPNGSRATARPRIDWDAVDRIRQGLNVPLLIKGVMTPGDAQSAIQHGAHALIVSNHGGAGGGRAAPIEVLASIADAAGGRAAVLIDGSFRRGTDILKALVLGARGVLIARPAMWGLAAYGADGVRSVIEMLQNELARNMAMIGAPRLDRLDRSMVRVHTPNVASKP